VITSPHFDFPWLTHGFGLRDSAPPSGLTTVKQIHSAVVLDACGRRGEQIGEGDAIISGEAGVAIGIRTADCVPVLLVDPVTRTVACVHAGWRGTAAGILGATIRQMALRGCRAKDLCVAIGPSIGSCCYEVGPDVAQQLGSESRFPDLPGINESQALAAGVRKIWQSGECTFCRPERFYSYRREKENAGRMLSFVSRLG
jgi:hypothetical protein